MTPFDSRSTGLLTELAGGLALGSFRGVEALDRVARLALQVLGCEGIALLIYGEDGDPWLHCQPAVEGDLARILLRDVDAGLAAGTVLELTRTQVRLAGGAPLRWARLHPLHDAASSFVGVLVALGGGAAPPALDADATMALLAGVVEDELGLMRIGVRDHLTGLFNRRFFDEMANREWRRAKREALPVSVLVADVDHFKAFNDTYGHQEGDRVLGCVARCLASTFRRAADLLARYGGEEFAAILPQTDLAGGRRAAERLCEAVVELQIAHVGSPSGVVTISVGVATAGAETAEGSDLTGFTKAADEALYRAKRNGRARVEVAEV